MNKKLNTILTIVISFIVVIGIIIAFIVINNQSSAKTNGTVTIELMDLSERLVSSKKIEFNEEDTLVILVKENYDNVYIENNMLLAIENFTTDTANWSHYISILVNGEYSMEGINNIELTNGMIITFKLVEYIPYE